MLGCGVTPGLTLRSECSGLRVLGCRRRVYCFGFRDSQSLTRLEPRLSGVTEGGAMPLHIERRKSAQRTSPFQATLGTLECFNSGESYGPEP